MPGVAGPLLWPQGRVGTAPCSIAAEEQPVWGQELASPRGICPAGRRVNCQPSSQFTSINNFAKTNIYCAFLGSAKANFHFSSSSTTSPLHSFPQPSHPKMHTTSTIRLHLRVRQLRQVHVRNHPLAYPQVSGWRSKLGDTQGVPCGLFREAPLEWSHCLFQKGFEKLLVGRSPSLCLL